MTPADHPAETLATTGATAPGVAGADGFTHLGGDGSARMVDVTAKSPTVRSATAEATVLVSPDVLDALTGGTVPKGDVWAVARIAGIQAAKRCAELLPLAHVIGVHGATVDFEVGQDRIRILATTRTADRTGVEMEAMTAASVAGLAMVDMVKGLDRSVELTGIRLLEKTGGRSGTWRREDQA
jgi:cyclic pyranopterin monophosphate synthase